jgi:hypothetical protein
MALKNFLNLKWEYDYFLFQFFTRFHKRNLKALIIFAKNDIYLNSPQVIQKIQKPPFNNRIRPLG